MPKPVIPSTPEGRRGFRAPEYVRSIVLRMGAPFIECLDELCDVNNRSRRELIEILVAEAHIELQEDASARINPL